MRKKKGKESGNASDASEGHFYLIVAGEGGVSQQRESGDKTESDRDGEVEKQPDNGGSVCKERLSRLSQCQVSVCSPLGNFM